MKSTIGRTVIVTIWLVGVNCFAEEPLPTLRLALAPVTAAPGVDARVADQLTDALAEAFNAQPAFAVIPAGESRQGLETAAQPSESEKDRARSAASRVGADVVLMTRVLAISQPAGRAELQVESTLSDVVAGVEVGYYRHTAPGAGEGALASAARECASRLVEHFGKASRVVGQVLCMSMTDAHTVVIRTEDGAALHRGDWVYVFREGKRVGGVELTQVAPKQVEGRVRYLEDTARLAPGDVVAHAFTPRTSKGERQVGNVLKGLLLLGVVAAIINSRGDRAAPPGPIGSIAVDSTPRGADILLDAVATGQRTPYTLTGVAAGPHALTLRRQGYSDATVNVAVLTGQAVNANAVLQPVQPPAPAPGP